MTPKNDKLSVALVSPGWPAGKVPNGIVSYTSTMVDAFRAHGVAPFVISMSQPVDNQDEFVACARAPKPSTSWPARVKNKLVFRFAPDRATLNQQADAIALTLRDLQQRHSVQLLEMEETFGWAKPVVIALKNVAPVVVRLHGPWFLNGVALGVAQDAAFSRRNQAERSGILAAAAVTSPSQDVLDQVRQRFNIELPDAKVIPNPVLPVPIEQCWSLQTCDRNRVLFVGRFDRHKGGDIVLDAFAQVLKTRPDAKLTFVGPDKGMPDDAGKQWKMDDYLAHRFPTPETRRQVEWTGPLAHGAIAALRKSALLTVVASRYENFPLAAAEAMVFGSPVIVSASGGLKEMIQHDRNGLRFEPGKPDDLARRILELLASPETCERLGRQARIDCVARYHPDQVARQTIEVYERVLGRTFASSKFPARNLAAANP